VEFLNSSNLESPNQGNEPNFCSGSRLEVIDITLGSYKLVESFTGWEDLSEPSLSDQGHILFTLWGSIPVCLIWKPRGTNWGSFREGLRDRLERGPEMNMKDEVWMGLAVCWVQHTLDDWIK
jgi:hypothetical protein